VGAVAGRGREAVLGTRPTAHGSAMTRGLILSVLSGLGAAFINFGLAFSGPLLASAQQFGASPFWAPNTVWLPFMTAGAAPNIYYCLRLFRKKGTADRYADSRTTFYWPLAFGMAVFWFGSTLLYCVSTEKLGSLGPILGWPLFTSLVVIMASLIGVITGEWKGTGRTPLCIQFTGVGVLVPAVFVLAMSSHWI